LEREKGFEPAAFYLGTAPCTSAAGYQCGRVARWAGARWGT